MNQKKICFIEVEATRTDTLFQKYSSPPYFITFSFANLPDCARSDRQMIWPKARRFTIWLYQRLPAIRGILQSLHLRFKKE